MGMCSKEGRKDRGANDSCLFVARRFLIVIILHLPQQPFLTLKAVYKG